jgi:predicted RNA-binding Zn-ribbon protein involved in translation (DUF1610 family)
MASISKTYLKCPKCGQAMAWSLKINYTDPRALRAAPLTPAYVACSSCGSSIELVQKNIVVDLDDGRKLVPLADA